MNSFIKKETTEGPEPLLAVLVPCYNEEEIITRTICSLKEVLNNFKITDEIDECSFVLFVDDGSTDNTFSRIKEHVGSDIKVLKLFSNVGHQKALTAGMHFLNNKVDCLISIDADLQDDLSVIKNMLSHYKEGAHVVYGIRSCRESDSFFKRTSARMFYSFMETLGTKVLKDHADFRLLSGVALSEFAKYKEANLFLRGIIPMMGLTYEKVYYRRLRRKSGRTKYSLTKMLSLTVNGLTSFSNRPIRFISTIGVTMFLTSIILAFWIFYVVIKGDNIPGWASTALVIDLLGGIQLLALGVIGEYISKIYLEIKARPAYHIEGFFE